MKFNRRETLVAAITVALSGCSALPSDGPLRSTVVADQDKPDTTGYEVVDVDAEVVRILAGHARKSLEKTFGNSPPAPQQTVRPGDVLQVTIWEASSGGLFSGATSGTGSRAETLPPQTVDARGYVTLPFVGELKVSGQTNIQVGKLIEQRLEGKAIEPQVLVAVQQSGATAATVTGDVTGAARVQLNPKGDRLMEVVAQGGGVKAAPNETFVRVTRGGRTVSVSLATILERPSENIYVHPGDLIYVSREPQTFTALGAVTKSGDLPIDREGFTLAQALGVSGGLNDNLADSGGVFLFRFEQADVVRALRPTSPLLAGKAAVPVIYRLNFATPSSYFLAKAFVMANQDVVYVANAPTVEFMKFMVVLRQIVSTGRSARSLDPNN